MSDLRTLVVDDYPQMRGHLVKLLLRLSISAIEAECGTDALVVLRRQPIDIVFTDLVMPEMDGMELCEEVRRRPDLRHIPLIVTSTHRDAAYVIQALQRGADDYISKPATEHSVRRALTRVMSHV